jgi:hypothetical protein
MRNTLPPLRSNDLFGGDHLASTRSVLKPPNHSKFVGSIPAHNHAELDAKKRGSDCTNQTRSVHESTRTKPRDLRHALPFSFERFNADFSGNQTVNVVWP